MREPTGSGPLHTAVLESALDAIVTIDGTGRILEFNPAAERIFGHVAEDVVGRDLGDVIVPPELRAQHRAGLARYVDGGPGRMLDRHVETTALRADGERFPVELAITRIPLGGPPLFTGHIRDITVRRRHEEDLRLSRERLVTAGDAARRRIERDLHDGAQQRLLALALELRMAVDVLDEAPAEARTALEDVQRELAAATQELRDLARGIHPAALSDRGLHGALDVVAGLSPVPVRLLAVPDERLPEAIEASVYFLVCETLTNVARHAEASVVDVGVRHAGGEVIVEVHDDGHGGAHAGAGTGLGGLADRVEALGGRLEVDSPPGGPTVVRAVLPCAW